jgi:ribosomal protein S10
MIFEAILWTLTTLVAPEVFGSVWGRWEDRLDQRLLPLVSFGRMFRSLGIPYLAVITGAVAARDVGLSGQTGSDWLRGGLVCAGVLGIAWVVVGSRQLGLPYSGPVPAATDEPRWALYRGTGSLLADPVWVGPLIGLGLGLIEWALKQRVGAERVQPYPDARSSLGRVCGSTILFFLTHYLWLIVFTQIGLSLIFGGRLHAPHGDQA